MACLPQEFNLLFELSIRMSLFRFFERAFFWCFVEYHNVLINVSKNASLSTMLLCNTFWNLVIPWLSTTRILLVKFLILRSKLMREFLLKIWYDYISDLGRLRFGDFVLPIRAVVFQEDSILFNLLLLSSLLSLYVYLNTPLWC